MRKGKRSAAPSEILSIKKRIGSEDVDGIRPVCNCDSGSVTAVRYVKSYNLKTAELIRAADTRIQCMQNDFNFVIVGTCGDIRQVILHRYDCRFTGARLAAL